jgi:hypothetical protein
MQSVAGQIVITSESEMNLSAISREGLEPSHVVMSRFASVEEAHAYAVLPPTEALRQGDPRSPATSLLELIFEILPVEGQNTSDGVL